MIQFSCGIWWQTIWRETKQKWRSKLIGIPNENLFRIRIKTYNKQLNLNGIVINMKFKADRILPLKSINDWHLMLMLLFSSVFFSLLFFPFFFLIFFLISVPKKFSVFFSLKRADQIVFVNHILIAHKHNDWFFLFDNSQFYHFLIIQCIVYSKIFNNFFFSLETNSKYVSMMDYLNRFTWYNTGDTHTYFVYKTKKKQTIKFKCIFHQV